MKTIKLCGAFIILFDDSVDKTVLQEIEKTATLLEGRTYVLRKTEVWDDDYDDCPQKLWEGFILEDCYDHSIQEF